MHAPCSANSTNPWSQHGWQRHECMCPVVQLNERPVVELARTEASLLGYTLPARPPPLLSFIASTAISPILLSHRSPCPYPPCRSSNRHLATSHYLALPRTTHHLTGLPPNGSGALSRLSGQRVSGRSRTSKSQVYFISLIRRTLGSIWCLQLLLHQYRTCNRTPPCSRFGVMPL